MESQINSKLGGANARREDIVKTSIDKLSRSNKERLERGNKELAKSKNLAKKNLLSAVGDLQRQLTVLKVDRLAITNDNKIRRGQMAIELSKINVREKLSLSDDCIE